MIECICIDSKNRPQEIPLSKWINEGMKYHITHVYYHPMQGIQGCELHEVKLKDCYPYESYRLSRFGFTKEALQDLMEMIKLNSELNKIEIHSLLRDLEIVENVETNS